MIVRGLTAGVRVGEVREIGAGVGRPRRRAAPLLCTLLSVFAACGAPFDHRALASAAIHPPGGPSPPSTLSATTLGATASFTLGCPASPPNAVQVDCIGQITLSAHKLPAGHSFTLVSSSSGATNVVVGRSSYRVTPGETGTVTVNLNPLGQRLLDRFYKYPATATATGALTGTLPVSFAYGLVKSASFVWTWSFAGPVTRLLQFEVRGIPTGGTVLMVCHGGGCPFTQRTVPAIGRISLTSQFKGASLKPGTTLWFAVTGPNDVAKVALFKISGDRVPSEVFECLPPGVATPRRCVS
jgi:hypothetical protein